jgi:hypothetical protein
LQYLIVTTQKIKHVDGFENLIGWPGPIEEYEVLEDGKISIMQGPQ